MPKIEIFKLKLRLVKLTKYLIGEKFFENRNNAQSVTNSILVVLNFSKALKNAVLTKASHDASLSGCIASKENSKSDQVLISTLQN